MNIDTSHALMPGMHGAFLKNAFNSPPTDALPPTADVRHGLAPLPLDGLRLAVKDVFDVKGARTGGGNPRWLETQPIAGRTAIAVRTLLVNGATWVGKTVTDELTYSLAGINVHYGTPVNPACPDRLPGGSSSGSAVCVAAGDADIALGTDCGGSVRLPASYCGLWGMRPTHGRIAGTGCFALAHSFDTVGWFARDGHALAAVFARLAGGSSPEPDGRDGTDAAACAPTRWIHAKRIGPLLDPPVRAAWEALLPELDAFEGVEHIPEALEAGLTLTDWAVAFRTLQAAEVWMQHCTWFKCHGASLGADVRQRFEQACGITPAQVTQAQRLRVQASALMAGILSEPGSMLVMPTVPTVAPRLDEGAARVDDIRRRSQQVLCIAGLAGLPQVSLPWIRVEGAPVGLSLVGARGDDEGVLAAALRLAGWMQARGRKAATNNHPLSDLEQ